MSLPKAGGGGTSEALIDWIFRAIGIGKTSFNLPFAVLHYACVQQDNALELANGQHVVLR